MRCVDCDCRHPIRIVRWDPTIKTWRIVTIQECWGVKEPFEIKDISMECTEYPEKRAKTVRVEVGRDMINDNMMGFVKYLLTEQVSFIAAQVHAIDDYYKHSKSEQCLIDVKDIEDVLKYVNDECDEDFILECLEEYKEKRKDGNDA